MKQSILARLGRAARNGAAQMRAGEMMRFVADERATSVVEFALVVPMLVSLLTGVADFGLLISQSIQVSTAAQAGAQYAETHGFDATKIAAAVTSSTTLTGISATPTPTTAQSCVSGQTLAACTSGTGGSVSPGTYITVSAQAPFTPTLSIWASVMPTTTSAQAIVRIS